MYQSTGNSRCFNIQALLETLDHGIVQVSTTHEEQTPYSLFPPTLTRMTGFQHLAGLVLRNATPGTTTPNAHQYFTCPIYTGKTLVVILHSEPLSQLEIS